MGNQKAPAWTRPAWAGVALALAMGAALAHQQGHWAAPAQEQDRVSPYEFGHPDMHRAHVVFETHCVACHGADLTSRTPTAKTLDPPPPDLLASGRMHPAGGLAWKIRTGRNAMPAFESTLSDREIWLMASFIIHVAGHHGAPGGGDEASHGSGHGTGKKVD